MPRHSEYVHAGELLSRYVRDVIASSISGRTSREQAAAEYVHAIVQLVVDELEEQKAERGQKQGGYYGESAILPIVEKALVPLNDTGAAN